MSDKTYVRESIEKAVQEKDAAALSKIVFAIESAVDEDIFEGPMDIVYDVQDKIGDVKTCQEISELFFKYGLTPPKDYEIYSFGDFLENPAPPVIVDFHLRVAREFKSIGFKLVKAQSAEDERQTAPHHIVEVHQIVLSVTVRQPHETSARLHRQFEKSIIIGNALFRPVFCQPYGKIDALVGLIVKLFYRREPNRYNQPAQLLLIISAYKSHLVVSHFLVGNQIDILIPQFPHYFGHGCLILF